MIIASFTKKNGSYAACIVKGHAGYAKRGKDIVCAAVSSVVSFAAELIKAFAPSSTVTSKESTTEVKIMSTDTSATVQTIYELMVRDLVDIAKEYPDNLSIEIKEE